eukprot:scaffold94276_cov57-Phaeocystis_antarctica.AAC.2
MTALPCESYTHAQTPKTPRAHFSPGLVGRPRRAWATCCFASSQPALRVAAPPTAAGWSATVPTAGRRPRAPSSPPGQQAAGGSARAACRSAARRCRPLQR